MAHRPKRTFRQRRTDSSDSDGSQESPAEAGAPAEQAASGRAEAGSPFAGRREAVTERPLRARGPRGRGRVWASSRRCKEAAPHEDGGSGGPESRMVDLSTDEEDGAHHSSENKDDQSSSSDSSLSQEEEFTSIVNIPDAAFIQSARRKRELARAQNDYISLEVQHISTVSGMKKDSDEDPESEPDDHEKRIPFTPKPQTLRQRMAEETTTRNKETSEESQDENQDIWEQQQMRKAVKITEINITTGYSPLTPAGI
ncbi:intron Large complex component GCFC2 isoform X4 [Talpa occidentalis]|uniref:intron Large complex component GCFC2 isoform X4 n=1 Tax=Talpa occidentalis TaxID=50954 RepID=UPI0023F7029C|nr:intron Large complex component GCFC2 isoform X4 [Talpa occidentalis]